MSRPAAATIHLAALRHNLAEAKRRAPRSRVMAVVKADAYGHGLERVARVLADADAFGVASVQDGQRLRAAGAKQRIVVLSGIDEAADLIAARRLRLELAIHHQAQIEMIERDRDPSPLSVWLKIDTGMHRLGFASEQARSFHARLAGVAAVGNRIGLMTHFAASDEADKSATEEQIACFERVTRDLPGERSLANSAGMIAYPQAHADWVRVGGLLYGVSAFADRTGSDLGFRPAMSLSTRLIAINRVAKGERVGYAGTYTCPEDMDIGVAAIGYGDGYPRHSQAHSVVSLGGRDAPLVGRVSMDLLTVDLRRHPDAKVGDRVLLWGDQLPVERVAAGAGTIGYDLVCGVTRRVLYVEDDTG